MKSQPFENSHTSHDQNARIEHFLTLKNKHSENAFILVGNRNKYYRGAICIQFHKTIQQSPKKEEIQMQLCSETEVVQSCTILYDQNFANKTINNEPFVRSQCKGQFSLPSIPIYNNDKQIFTPAFMDPQTKLNEYKLQQTFIGKESKSLDKQIMLPRLISKSMYCSVCKSKFQEYLDHINSFMHQQSIKNVYSSALIRTMELLICPNQLGKRMKELEKIGTELDLRKTKIERKFKKALKSSNIQKDKQEKYKNMNARWDSISKRTWIYRSTSRSREHQQNKLSQNSKRTTGEKLQFGKASIRKITS